MKYRYGEFLAIKINWRDRKTDEVQNMIQGGHEFAGIKPENTKEKQLTAAPIGLGLINLGLTLCRQ